MGIATFPAGSSGISTAQQQWVLLDSDTSTGYASTRTLSNISQSYSMLKIIASGFINNTGSNYGNYFIFNGDNGTNYYWSWVWTGVNSTSSGGTTAAANFDNTAYGDSIRNNTRHWFEINVYNYNTTQPKIVDGYVRAQQGSNNNPFSVDFNGIYRASTPAAITSVTYTGNSIGTGSSASNYGLFIYGCA